MIIGFTGTRNGMTAAQRTGVRALVIKHGTNATGLHGDCVGADEDFNYICMSEGLQTCCRPCTFDNLRANCTVAISDPKQPMARNRDIVADADLIIACPPNFERIKSGSGTWATIGFAEKAGKPLYVVFPDGRIESLPPRTVQS